MNQPGPKAERHGPTTSHHHPPRGVPAPYPAGLFPAGPVRSRALGIAGAPILLVVLLALLTGAGHSGGGGSGHADSGAAPAATAPLIASLPPVDRRAPFRHEPPAASGPLPTPFRPLASPFRPATAARADSTGR
jgi:hypothetical protein